MADDIANRKTEHVNIVLNDQAVDRCGNYFDQIRLRHRALPEISIEEVDTSVEFLGKKLSFPLIISSMTGGSDADLKTINQNLATAAEATGVAMGVGSQRIMFSDEAAKESFNLREFAPDSLLFANLGAVQLNYGFGLEHAKAAVDILKADALYLHLNPLQEAIQPEGDTNFANLAEKISELQQELNVPIIIKEVGAGISAEDAELLYSSGIRYIDVAGSGGTSWSRIEHFRQDSDKKNDLGLLFQDWGIPTPKAIEDIADLDLDINLISSGGVRTGIDIVKSIILGAQVAGMAKPFLAPAQESAEAVIAEINNLKGQFCLAMFLLGVKTIEDVFSHKELIT